MISHDWLIVEINQIRRRTSPSGIVSRQSCNGIGRVLILV